MLPSLLLAAAAMTPAADPTPEQLAKADEAIHKYLAREVERLETKFMAGARTKAEWDVKRPKLKEEFLDMLGLWPVPEKTPLKATVTGTLERGDVAVEKVHFQSRPGLYVTGNLYRPKSPPKDKKLPAILYVCGHSGRGRDGNKTAFQDHGLWFATNGYVCLVVDTLQLGEVAGKHHGTYNLGRFWWQDRGYTPAGVECWNGIRAIDYLCTRPDVDPERIGVTGISGGGATTVWVAAADDRVKVAVPVSGMSDLTSYVTNKVINGHCDCMFFINTYKWEWTTALMLHAPKPLLFANSDDDKIFPMDGNRRIIDRLRKGYELLGKKENVDEYVSKGGHDYRPDLRLAIFGFLNRHLKNDTGPVKDADFPKIEGKELRVFPEDADLPKDQINDRVDEVFVPKAEVRLPEKKEEFAAWKAGLVKRLREQAFRGLLPVDLDGNLKEGEVAKSSIVTKSGLDVGWFGHVKPYFTNGLTTVVVLNPDDDPYAGVEKWIDQYPNGGMFTMYPRGGGMCRWVQKNPPNTVERSMALLGQTVDSGRVWDVVSAGGSILSQWELRLMGRKQAGVIAAMAVHLHPPQEKKWSVQEVVLIDPPTSFRDGPHFLNVERVIDLPTALGLLAPDVKLTLINAKDKAFDKTAAIYKLAGAEGKFERK